MDINPHTMSTLEAEVARLQNCLAELEQAINEQPAYEDDVQAIFDNVNDAMVIHLCDQTGTILEVNQKMLELFCIERALAMSGSLRDLVSPDYPDEDMAMIFRQTIAGEFSRFRWRARRPLDQTEFEAEWTLRRVTFRQQPCILATVHDISQRHLFDQAILKHSTLLRGFLDHCPASMFVRDTQGRFIVINHFYANLLKHTPDEIIGKTPYDIMPADAADLFLANDRQVLETGQVVQREEDTSLGIFSAIKFPIYDEHGQIAAVGGISLDISKQKHAEADYIALQQQVIDTQQAALHELSTPLLPISDNVVVMPLIGTIDSQRAQMVLETLLEGVARYQADLAILDITGVQVVDTQVADALMRTARAVRLLGAGVMLTGIQPQIAQTLVHLGVDLSGIMMKASLQEGIAYALSEAQDLKRKA